MDTLTHALSGALLARATAPSNQSAPLSLRERTLAGTLVASFPDIDNVLRLGDPLTFLNAHRGITHSLVLLPLWAVLLAWLLSWAFRRLRGRDYPWKAFLGVCALGLAIHIAGDLITPFGTQLWAPLSVAKYALNTTFVIDLLFSAIVFFGLLASIRWPQAGARVALVVLVGYVGFQGFMRQEALSIAEQYARARGTPDARLHALPQPFSPLHWKLVVSDGELRAVALVRLGDLGPLPLPGLFGRIAAAYRPVETADWTYYQHFGWDRQTRSIARQVWWQSKFVGFRRFAELPVLYRLDRSGEQVCAWFTDLRFIVTELPAPFRFGMCQLEPGGRWQLYRLKPFSTEARELLAGNDHRATTPSRLGIEIANHDVGPPTGFAVLENGSNHPPNPMGRK